MADNDHFRSDLMALLNRQHDIVTKLYRTVAGLQFALLALAGGTDDPDKLNQSIETVRSMVLPGLDPKEIELKEAVLEQLDLLSQQVADTRAAKGSDS